MSRIILNLIRPETGSQWRSNKIGVMWSYLVVLRMIEYTQLLFSPKFLLNSALCLSFDVSPQQLSLN